LLSLYRCLYIVVSISLSLYCCLYIVVSILLSLYRCLYIVVSILLSLYCCLYINGTRQESQLSPKPRWMPTKLHVDISCGRHLTTLTNSTFYTGLVVDE